jgi:hypothetical protein
MDLNYFFFLILHLESHCCLREWRRGAWLINHKDDFAVAWLLLKLIYYWQLYLTLEVPYSAVINYIINRFQTNKKYIKLPVGIVSSFLLFPHIYATSHLHNSKNFSDKPTKICRAKRSNIPHEIQRTYTGN